MRILLSQVFVSLVLIFALFSTDVWGEHYLIDSGFEFTGLILVGAATVGRLWTSLYISGYKTTTLVITGPYSIVRNPLYVFSFIGAVGLGLSSESIVMTLVVAAAFTLYYLPVVIREENVLAGVHGRAYADYAAVTPRLIPSFARYAEPDVYSVSTKTYRRALLDSSVFIILYAVLQVIERLHDAGILPVLFRLP